MHRAVRCTCTAAAAAPAISVVDWLCACLGVLAVEFVVKVPGRHVNTPAGEVLVRTAEAMVVEEAWGVVGKVPEKMQ